MSVVFSFCQLKYEMYAPTEKGGTKSKTPTIIIIIIMLWLVKQTHLSSLFTWTGILTFCDFLYSQMTRQAALCETLYYNNLHLQHQIYAFVFLCKLWWNWRESKTNPTHSPACAPTVIIGVNFLEVQPQFFLVVLDILDKFTEVNLVIFIFVIPLEQPL